jgi:hypothetical protein
VFNAVLLQFWSDMAELDENTWVLEPETPNLADLHRRIVVAKHAYLDITIKFDTSNSMFFLSFTMFAVMQRIPELLHPHWHWSALSPPARPCVYTLEITDGQAKNRFWTIFVLPCRSRPFRRLLDTSAPLQSKKRDWLLWSVAFATLTACRYDQLLFHALV